MVLFDTWTYSSVLRSCRSEMTYKTETYSKSHSWGTERGVEVKAKNGRVVATCLTQSMADKVAKGLALVDHEAKKMKEFRL